MKKWLNMTLLLLLYSVCFAKKGSLPLPLNSDPNWHKAFINVAFTNSQGEILPYRLYIPEKIKKNQQYPLVIYFHGYGMGKADNTHHLEYNTFPNLLSMEETQKKYPAFILVPNCLHPKQWAHFELKRNGFTNYYTKSNPYRQTEITQPMQQTIELIEILQDKYAIDKHKVIVTGASMGGIATWDIIMRYPEKFSAAIPFCGFADNSKASHIKDVPIWNFHGSKDKSVNVVYSRQIIQAIKDAGGKPIYTETKNGHGIERPICVKELRNELLKWMYSQELKQ